VHPELAPFQKGKVADWLLAIGRLRPTHQQRQIAGVILCFWWHVWKERNNRIFEDKECSFLQIVEQTKNAITAYSKALPSQ
jgi:hypothetical protein